MLNYRRQRSLTESVQFQYLESKAAPQESLLTSSLVIAGVSKDELDRKKLLSDNPFLKSALNKTQELFGFENNFSQTEIGIYANSEK